MSIILFQWRYTMNKHENIINVNRKAYNQLAQEFNSRDERLESYEKELYTYISNYVKKW